MCCLFFYFFNGLTADEKTAVIELSGNFGCRICSRIITRTLRKVDGAKRVEMDADGYKVTVTYDDDKTDIDALETALMKKGFNANGKEADIMAWQSLPNCCKK